MVSDADIRGDKMRARSRFRKLRIVWSVVWGILAIVLITLWLRSSLVLQGSSIMDRITWHYEGSKAIQFGTEPGQVNINTFADRPVPAAYASQVDREWMTEWFASIRLFGGKTQWWFDVHSGGAFFNVGIPDWFLLSICCGLAALPWFSCHFSLRALLIAMTLIATLLWLIFWAARQ